jgi:hypothetical protein
MIPQELIDRLEKDCEWMAKEMPEKFVFDLYTLYQKDKNGICTELIKFGYMVLWNPILSDPLCEYPNALHRIVKEVAEKEFSIERLAMPTLGCRFYPSTLIPPIILHTNIPLHAEIEVTCIAIEGMMK